MIFAIADSMYRVPGCPQLWPDGTGDANVRSCPSYGVATYNTTPGKLHPFREATDDTG